MTIDCFLRPEIVDALIAEFPAFSAGKAVNELGQVGGKAVVPRLESIGPTFKALDWLLKDPSFLRLMSEITGIPALVYDPEYIGGGTHENRNGQDLDPHVDFNYHPTGLHRRLNLILFLNREWEAQWGGCLELQRDPWNPQDNCAVTIVPLANRAVIFETTERSWHGFERITLPEDRSDLSRKSIAVYYYTRERPVEETAHSHGTVYVPRPLPQQLQTGYALRDEDVYELQVLWERRNSQLRFLYERELEFSEALADMRNSLSFRLGRALTWPARAIRRGMKRRN